MTRLSTSTVVAAFRRSQGSGATGTRAERTTGLTMTRLRLISVLLASAVLLFVSTATAQQPTMEGAQGDFASGDYRSALQKISRLLTGPTARPGTPHRYELLLLRGECMLQLKEANFAADAFDAAARSVKGEGTVTLIADAGAAVP